MLYGDGKLLLQIDKNENPLVQLSEAKAAIASATKDLGTTTLNGEVIDPKCYFGVMKPGEGKVHKDCAIRCIAGGIPPVLVVTNEKGERNYVLLVGAKGEKLNDKVKDFVAVSSTVTGGLSMVDDWLVMYVREMKNDIALYSANNFSQASLQASLHCATFCCNKN